MALPHQGEVRPTPIEDNKPMYRSCRKLASVLFAGALALSLVVALTLPGLARSAEVPSSKIEARLAKLAARAQKDAKLHIILRGDSKDRLFRKYAATGQKLPLIGGVAITVRVKDLAALAADPHVSFVLANPPVQPESDGGDFDRLVTTYPFADQLDKVSGETNGRGVGIAVIDSGVAPLPDFGSRLVQIAFPGQTWANDDTHGHGTLVAGIAAGKSSDGKFVGIASGATVYALNVNNPAGVRSSDVIAALQWVFENAHTYNIRVVNISLAETLPSSYQTSTLDLAVERVWAAGIAVVVAAGNKGLGAVDYAPANDPLALSVGSSDTLGTKTTLDDTVASFSAVGPTQDGYLKPELLAPGRLIGSILPAGTTLGLHAPSANRIVPGYATISGTSFSAPQAAGAAALLFQRHPNWSPDNVKWVLAQKGHSVLLSPVKGLDLEKATDADNPGRANQGVSALVCAPSGATCVTGGQFGTVSSSWNSSSWNSSSWNSSSWNSSSWNSSSWNSSSWNSSSWNGSSWNGSSWNSSSWNSSSWNSSSWD